MSRVQKESRVEVVVPATPEGLWQVLSDVTRIGEWSHECRSARWLGEVGGPHAGSRFRGRNRAGRLRWDRTSEIVTADAPRLLVWRTVSTLLFPDSTEWRIELAPCEGGTRVTQSFAVLHAPRLLDRLYARLIPSHQDRDAQLTEDLYRLGALAGRGARS